MWFIPCVNRRKLCHEKHAKDGMIHTAKRDVDRRCAGVKKEGCHAHSERSDAMRSFLIDS